MTNIPPPPPIITSIPPSPTVTRIGPMTPRWCPVCNGRGTLPTGFYPNEHLKKLLCPLCRGARIV